jgi:hypothetical protein
MLLLKLKLQWTEAEDSKKMESDFSEGMFKVESSSAGADSANDYKDFTIDFANDMSIKVNTLAQLLLVLMRSSELDGFLRVEFSEMLLSTY